MEGCWCIIACQLWCCSGGHMTMIIMSKWHVMVMITGHCKSECNSTYETGTQMVMTVSCS